MSTMRGNACRMNETLPPPVAHEYQPTGSWLMVGDLYTYITGPPSSSKAVVFIYDAFGPSYQVLQGADRLAAHLNILVLVPDYFKGCGADHEDLYQESGTGQAALKEHMACHGDYDKTTAATMHVVATAQTMYPLINSWGVFGLCWGGKVAVLASRATNSPFRVSGQAHPLGMDADDARAIMIPHVCLPSKDESQDVVAEYARLLHGRGMGEVETFEAMGHGWMGARANLGERAGSSEFERGYARAARFLARYL